MTIGEKIKELRKRKGMSQEKLAKKVGVNISTVCWWETQRTEPSIFNCILLADVFGVTLDELCCREVKKNGQND
jgi:transcriptional regulator with XRE-family HTH domain